MGRTGYRDFRAMGVSAAQNALEASQQRRPATVATYWRSRASPEQAEI